MIAIKDRLMKLPACFVRVVTAVLFGLLLLPGAVAVPTHTASAAGQADLTFNNGTLLRDQSNGHIYLYWDGTRHWILDPPTLDALGYAGTSWTPLTSDQIATITNGSTLEVKKVNDFVYPPAPITSSQVSLLLNKASAAPGQSLTLSGGGFSGGETITITAPGISFTTEADSSGNLTATVPVPSAVTLGLHHIFVHGDTSGDFGVEVFHVIASASVQLAVAPPAVAPGTSVSVTGSGFQGGENVQLFVGTLTATQVTAGADGSFGPASVTVPGNAPFQNVTVVAFGASSSRFAGKQLSIQAATTPTATPAPTQTAVPHAAVITLNTGQAHRGSRIVVSGDHFRAGESVVIRLKKAVVRITRANQAGDTHAAFRVPVHSAIGRLPVTATGLKSGAVAVTYLRVVPPGKKVGVVATPDRVKHGHRITVTGHGYAAFETVALQVRGAFMLAVKTNGVGTFVTSFRVPTWTHKGVDQLQAIGARSKRAAVEMLIVV